MTLTCDRGAGNRSQVTCTQGNRSQVAANYAQINLSELPEPLRIRAESWRKEMRNVIIVARTDDAGEWRIMRLREGESPWVGWSMVNFNG